MATRHIQESHLRDLLVKKMPAVTWTKIESGSTVSGIPDLYGIVNGSARWIECKIINKDLTHVKTFLGEHLSRGELSGPQRNWHLAHRKAGGISWIIGTIRSLSYGSSWPLWIWSSKDAAALHEGKIVLPWHAGTVDKDDWPGIESLLFQWKEERE